MHTRLWFKNFFCLIPNSHMCDFIRRDKMAYIYPCLHSVPSLCSEKMEENILSCPKYMEEAIIICTHAHVFAAEWMKPYMGIEFFFLGGGGGWQSLTPQNYFSVYSKETAGEKCAHTHTHLKEESENLTSWLKWQARFSLKHLNWVFVFVVLSSDSSSVHDW